VALYSSLGRANAKSGIWLWWFGNAEKISSSKEKKSLGGGHPWGLQKVFQKGGPALRSGQLQGRGREKSKQFKSRGKTLGTLDRKLKSGF